MLKSKILCLTRSPISLKKKSCSEVLQEMNMSDVMSEAEINEIKKNGIADSTTYNENYKLYI